MNEYLRVFPSFKKYCEDECFKGYDPFDGLNSEIFSFFPFLKKSSLFQLAWIQLFKRNPKNLRKLFGIAKDINPKGIGLFLSAYCNLYKDNPEGETIKTIKSLVDELLKCSSKDYSGICWGYNFDWQSRAFFQPKGTPSIVVTSFIGSAFLDVYEILKDEKFLNIARSNCEFILKDLNRTFDDDGDFAFSYCPTDTTQVFNASLLGTRLLMRTYSHTKEPILLEESKRAVSFVCKHQQENGAWSYSPLPFHAWIDNFHTGYNLECIYTYQSISEDFSFQNNLKKGLDYYLDAFFEESGIPKYYNNSRYPIDMHNTAQLIITLSKMGILDQKKQIVDKVLSWSINHMFDQKKGFFYYQKTKFYTNKIPYMRWTQAWLFLAFSHYLLNSRN
jgi:rhamnogalacturonyl hydrolase YesR